MRSAAARDLRRGLGRALHRVPVELLDVRVARRVPLLDAHPEPHRDAARGALQDALVEHEAARRAVLEEEVRVVPSAREGDAEELLGEGRVDRRRRRPGRRGRGRGRNGWPLAIPRERTCARQPSRAVEAVPQRSAHSSRRRTIGALGPRRAIAAARSRAAPRSSSARTWPRSVQLRRNRAILLAGSVRPRPRAAPVLRYPRFTPRRRAGVPASRVSPCELPRRRGARSSQAFERESIPLVPAAEEHSESWRLTAKRYSPPPRSTSRRRSTTRRSSSTRRIIQEDPNDARTLLKMGDLQSKMEAYADAVAHLRARRKVLREPGLRAQGDRGLQADPRDHRAARPRSSRTSTRTSRRSSPSSTSSSGSRATRSPRSTRWPRGCSARTATRRPSRSSARSSSSTPTNPLPHLRLAEALSRAKDVDGAVLEFGIAAGQLVKLGRRDDALKVIERLLHHKPDADARAHRRRALPRAAAPPNDGMQALAKLQICFQANPRDLDTLGLLARAFAQIGQAAKAIEVQKEMARIARDTGKTDLFHELVAKLLEARPERRGREAARGAGSSMPPSIPAPPRAPSSVAAAASRCAESEAVGVVRRRRRGRHRVRRAAASSFAPEPRPPRPTARSSSTAATRSSRRSASPRPRPGRTRRSRAS